MSGTIYITGDKHGTYAPILGLAEHNQLREEDVLLIAGDAGYVWDESYAGSIATLQQFFPGVIAFVDGNHENHALLNAMEVCAWNGGRVHRVGDRVLHLMRGELYRIHGRTVFAFGGARSVDVDRREDGFSWWKEPGASWWPEEEPTEAEIAYGQRQLEAYWDEIEAHIARSKAIDPDYPLPALFDQWYRRLSGAPRFQKWYCGHMHVDQLIEPRLRVLHNNVLLLGEETRMRWA